MRFIGITHLDVERNVGFDQFIIFIPYTSPIFQIINSYISKPRCIFFFFYRKFQPMVSAPNDYSLSSDQDNNQFFGVGGD